jgi:quercetin dioxygenase-like cupin family protein
VRLAAKSLFQSSLEIAGMARRHVETNESGKFGEICQTTGNRKIGNVNSLEDDKMSENDQKTCQEVLEIRSVRLVDMIQYQSGAVVSRTILDKKMGTVTLFAFDQGQGLSEHTAPFDAMVHVIDGEAEIAIEGQPHGVKAGEMILMPANHPHAVRAIQRFKMLLVMIRS